MKLKLPKLNIFLKLVLTVLVFGLLLNVCVILVFRLSTDDKPRKYLKDFMRRMEQSIVTDIGIPPDTVKAKQICDDLDIAMRYEAPGREWSSSEDMPHLSDFMINPETRKKFEKDESILANYKGKTYSLFRYPQGVYIIKPFTPDFFKPERAIILLIGFISVIIIILYFYLRRLFKPLKELSAAVQQIGDGNYNINVPVNSADELGELAGSINEMSAKINSSLRAKEQLLMDVSHELRSPITRIKLGLAVDSSKEKIEEDVNEMERMVTSLLENYRNDTSFATLKLENLDLVSLMDDTVGEYLEADRIKFDKDTKDVYINGDFEKLQIVFRNLIDNALKYSTDAIEVSIYEKDGDAFISIKDKGTGIAEEDIKFIFEPFYRADRSRSRRTGGFGLGLSICKKIVDAHKGDIKINSKLNEGTEVLLKFKAEKAGK